MKMEMISGEYDCMKELKVFDDIKIGVKGLVDVRVEIFFNIFI